MNVIEHGWGIVEFQNAVSFDESDLAEWLHRREREHPYGYKELEDGTFLNDGGYIFTKEQINEAPQRILGLHKCANSEDYNFLALLMSAMDECVHEYCRLYETAKESIWWRSAPHIAVYRPGGHMGFHHDNAVGIGDTEVAIYQVLTGGMILSDKCEGGNLAFKHINKSFPPVAGTCFLYPSSYIGTHAVEPVKAGERISYLEFFGHGSAGGEWPFTHRTE